MKNKKTVSLLLLLSIFSSVFSCTSMGENEAASESDTSDNTTSLESSEYVPSNVSFNGDTVYIATHQWSTPWQIGSYDHVSVYEENADVINDALVKRTRQIEEEFEVKLRSYPILERNKPTEFTQAVAAGDDEFAFGLIMSCSMPTLLGTEGMLVDLNTVSTIDFSHSWWNQNAIEEMNLFGVQYAALGDLCLYAKGSPIVTYFNKQLIEDNKLDDPYELVENGTWTLDKMISMATDISRDIDGGGEIDENDIFGICLETDSQFYILAGCGVRFSTHDDKGINITIMNEKTVSVLEKLGTLINDRSISMDLGYYQNQKGYGNALTELFIPKLGNNTVLFLSNQLLAALNMRSLEVDFGVLPMPKYDESQEGYCNFSNTWFTDYVVIPSTNDDLSRTGALIEAMSYYSQQYITPAFIDNVVMNKSVRDEESAKIIKDIIDNMQYDIALIFNWGGIQETVTGMKNKTGQSYASVYAQSKSKILAAVEDTTALLKK